jgi:hypothetical protein
MHLTCCEIARIELEIHLTTGTFNLLSKTDTLKSALGGGASAWMMTEAIIRPRTFGTATLHPFAERALYGLSRMQPKNGAKVQRADRIQ